MAFIKELKALFPQLGNPRFVHFLLEPLLLWGILFGVIAWILSLWILKNRQAQVCSLILIAVSALAIFPVLHYRKKATAPSARLLNEQNERRRETQWVYYSLGALAVAGIFMTGEGKGKAGTILSLTLAGGGLAIVMFSLWLQEKEIAIFHPDARRQPKPPTSRSPAARPPDALPERVKP